VPASKPREDEDAKENTDYVGDPVITGENVLSNTPIPDKDSGRLAALRASCGGEGSLVTSGPW
jgi:hypothetical protein